VLPLVRNSPQLKTILTNYSKKLSSIEIPKEKENTQNSCEIVKEIASAEA